MNYQDALVKWKNSNKKSKGIKWIEFYEKEGELTIKTEGVASGLMPGKWEGIACKAYGASKDAEKPIAFQANFSTDDFDAYFQFNNNQGLLILAMLLDFKKEKDSSGIFIREFFSKYE